MVFNLPRIVASVRQRISVQDTVRRTDKIGPIHVRESVMQSQRNMHNKFPYVGRNSIFGESTHASSEEGPIDGASEIGGMRTKCPKLVGYSVCYIPSRKKGRDSLLRSNRYIFLTGTERLAQKLE